MTDFEKYRVLYTQSMPDSEIYQIAKEDGLNGLDLLLLLRRVFKYSWKDSKKMVEADGYTISVGRKPDPTLSRHQVNQFRQVYDATLEAAARILEYKLDKIMPRRFGIEVSGAAHSDGYVDEDEAFNHLFLGDDHYFYEISVIIRGVKNDFIRLAMMPTGHTPVPYEMTRNWPEGAGPFRFVNVKEDEWPILEHIYREFVDHGL